MAQRLNGPDLKKLLEKKVAVKLNKNRTVIGVLRGFDQFLNISLDKTFDPVTKQNMGLIMVRGNSIELIETLEVTQQQQEK